MADYEYFEDSEIESLISENDEKFITTLIKQFEKTRDSKMIARENELERLREQFVTDFPIQKLKEITKEEYAFGKGNTFCFRIENELVKLGNIHGATAVKFGLYYGKSGEDTIRKYRFSKYFGESADEAMDKIRKELIELLVAGGNGDFKCIRESSFSPMYRGKILSTYYPEIYLCIFVPEHLTYFMQKIGINVEPEDDILIWQRKLLEWMKKRPECGSWRVHDFSNFLYDTFGRPFNEIKKNQDERDKEYPREYVTKVDIKLKKWKEMLKNPEIFNEKDIALLKRFYKADNHATTCFDLGIQDGVSPSSYIKPVVALARRVMKATGIAPIYNNEGKQVWWRILFWGTYREDKHFEWKLQPKLAKAMAEVFKDLENYAGAEVEEKEDQMLVEELRHARISNIDTNFEYKGKPKAKQTPVYIDGHKTYYRDRLTALHALSHAGYNCEINVEHPSFMRRTSDKKYTEPHHLIPMSFSDKFTVSLDVEENIVSLCSNCHNEIHYGRDADKLIRKLYEERKADLAKAGITITLDKLLGMYGYKDEP